MSRPLGIRGKKQVGEKEMSPVFGVWTFVLFALSFLLEREEEGSGE